VSRSRRKTATARPWPWDPRLGLSQALVQRGYTRLWTWWIPADVISWVIVDSVVYLLARWFDALDFTRHEVSLGADLPDAHRHARR
jgi:hypothetical protein